VGCKDALHKKTKLKQSLRDRSTQKKARRLAGFCLACAKA